MKVWELESKLCGIKGFDGGDISLEQYMTPSETAARVALTMEGRYEDLREGITCDIGCGTGMLSIACSYLDAPFIIGVDIDEKAIQCAQQNTDACNLHSVDFVLADVLEADFLRADLVHSVVMNPPFGTKRAGADMAFLARGVRLAGTAVYSMHKTSTRGYIEKEAREWGISEAKVCFSFFVSLIDN